MDHFGDAHNAGKPLLYFETSGTGVDGMSYESESCDATIDPKFYHELLDEFLEAFARDPNTAKLKFGLCEEHSPTKRGKYTGTDDEHLRI